MEDHLRRNAEVWDERVRRGKAHTRNAGKADLTDPMKHIDPLGWLGGNVADQKVLCLASGGGLQSVLFAKAGAKVTVLDISEAMLNKDRKLAKELGLDIRVICGSMDDLSQLPISTFDLVVQPVSTCYVPDVVKVYREVAKVIRTGGLYISQHKQPGSLQASALPDSGSFRIEEKYYRTGPLKALPGEFEHREPGALEYLHRWELLIGGLCREGFVVEDLMEPRHENSEAPIGSFGHRSCFIPPYVLIKARRSEKSPLNSCSLLSKKEPGTRSGIIIPG